MISNTSQIGQLLFLFPEDPTKSFTCPYQKENQDSQTFADLFAQVIAEQEHHMEFSDCLGRKIQEDKPIRQYLALQPFYITKRIPLKISINIRLPDNEEIVQLEINPLLKNLQKVINHIEQTKGVPKERQKYFQGEKQIDRERSFADQQICSSGTEIKLILKSRIRVECSQNPFEIYADDDETVDTIKEMVYKRTNIVCSQQILLKGNQTLESGKLLSIYGIIDGDILTLKLKIHVVFMIHDCVLESYHEPSAKMIEVSDEFIDLIQRSENIKIDGNIGHFEYGGAILNDGEKILGDYTQESEIKLNVVPNNGSLLIRVHGPANTFYVIIEDKMKVLDMKALILRGTTCEKMFLLYYKDQELSSETILKDLNIPGNTVEFRYDISYKDGKMYAWTLGGSRWVIEGLSPSDTFRKVKQLISEKSEVSEDRLTLIYAGMNPKPDKTLAEYMFFDGGTIHVGIQLIGGTGGGYDPTKAREYEGNTYLQWSRVVPEWRSIHESGLCVEGKCTNKDCKAYDQWVMINKGMGTYDIVLDRESDNCPVCNKHVEGEKYAFTECFFEYIGVTLVEEGKPCRKVRSQGEEKVGTFEYMFLKPEVISKYKWMSFKILTRSHYPVIRKEHVCTICRKRLEERSVDMICDHSYHEECLQKVRKLYVRCVNCHI